MTPHDLAVCQQVVGGGDGLDDLRVAAAAGFTAVSLHTSRLADIPAERWRAELSALGLEVTGFMAIRGILDDPADAEDTMLVAGTLGARYVAVTTGPQGGRSRAEADAVCAGWFHRMQPQARRLGLRLALEPLHPLLSHLSYVHTVRDALAITSSAPAAGVLVDTGHLWCDPELTGDLVAAGDSIASVQLSDVPAEVVAGGPYDRVPLGAGVVPNAALVRALVAGGYAGPFEHETLCPGDDRVTLLATERRSLATLVGAC